MYGKSYWYGKEVEGRLSDIETVFVRGQIPKNYKDYPHIYFTIEYMEMACVHGNWDEIHRILETKQYVTIEANEKTMDKINDYHLLVETDFKKTDLPTISIMKKMILQNLKKRQ